MGILVVKPLRQADFVTHDGDDAKVIQPPRHVASRRWPALHTCLTLHSSTRLPLYFQKRQAAERCVVDRKHGEI
jgi:hypothetical protein